MESRKHTQNKPIKHNGTNRRIVFMGTFPRLNITMVYTTYCVNINCRIWIRTKQARQVMRKEFEQMSGKKAHSKVDGVSTHPDKGTKRYAANEKIINNNSALKKARDISQGIQKSDSAYGDTSSGKGSSVRGNPEEYKAQYDNIVWTKTEDKEKPKFKVRINGVLQYPEDDDE